MGKGQSVNGSTNAHKGPRYGVPTTLSSLLWALILVCHIFCAGIFHRLANTCTYRAHGRASGKTIKILSLISTSLHMTTLPQAVRPQKFALSFTLGSLCFLVAFAILQGPQAQLQTFQTRKVFAAFYFSSLFVTLGATFSVSGWIGYATVILSSTVQLLALAYYLVSFLPGGSAGLKYLTAAMMQLLKPIMIHCARFQAAFTTRFLSWLISQRNDSDAD